MPLMRRYFKSEEISKDVVGKVGTGRAGLSSAHARHNGLHQAGLPLPVGARHRWPQSKLPTLRGGPCRSTAHVHAVASLVCADCAVPELR